MSNDLYAQLSEYGSQTREAREPLSARDVANRVDQVPTVAAVQAPNGRRGWLVAVGAAIAVFVLIGGSVWLVSGNGADTVDEPLISPVSVPTTVNSGPVPTTTAPAGETGLRWVETKLSPSDVGADARTVDGNWYGYNVAVDADRIVIGSPTKYEGTRYAGAVYVYEPDGSGGWAETKLTASDGATSGGQFGMSVAVDGDIVVVGRPFGLDPDGGPPEATGSQGAAYVFESDGDGGWAETKLTASDPADLDEFGSSVAVSGDRIVVGAGGDDERSGAVYVFERDGQDGWFETKLTASDRAPREYFGYWASNHSGVPVAVEGDRIAVGSRSAVYLFEPDGNGGWAETRLGVSAFGVAIDGDGLVIGSESGVYTYERDATGAWNAAELATTAQGQGFWLDASDDRIAVTVDASWRTSGGPGLAYLVERNDEGDWFETVLKSPDTDPMDGGEWSYDDWGVAVDGNRVVVGAPYAFGNGVAYTYEWTSE